jgi:hypothetical protein
MSTPHPQPKTPTAKQLRYLRDLALKTGQTFTYPRTAVQASREIERLKGTPGTSGADCRRELRQVGRDMAERRGDAARVDVDSETEGYGSSARWRGAA